MVEVKSAHLYRLVYLSQSLQWDILPVYLLKAIWLMTMMKLRELGIYEIVEEDLALCEFVDVSKHPVQELVRKGIELIQYS